MNYRDTEFNALESNTPYNYKRLAQSYTKISYIKSATEDNNFENETPDQTLNQIYLSEYWGNLQHSFSMDQLEKLEEVHPNGMVKYNTDIKDKYQFD